MQSGSLPLALPGMNQSHGQAYSFGNPFLRFESRSREATAPASAAPSVAFDADQSGAGKGTRGFVMGRSAEGLDITAGLPAEVDRKVEDFSTKSKDSSHYYAFRADRNNLVDKLAESQKAITGLQGQAGPGGASSGIRDIARQNPGPAGAERRPGASPVPEPTNRPPAAVPSTPAVRPPAEQPSPPSTSGSELTIDRKIIRTAVASYEVESFDKAQAAISSAVSSARGYISSSNSEKLPNGKVRGQLVLRMPPEALEPLMSDLRSIGELKSQNVEAADVTRQFVDTDSQLKAARAVEKRLLDIIANGKGEIKDLVAAENQLGEWRTKIERMEGELRYLSNQVALSTLTLTITEKDIASAAVAVATEVVAAVVEAREVEKARNGAVEAIVAAKGRVLESEVKQQEDGAAVARLVAELPQEASAGFINALRSLGTVSKLEVEKKQTTEGPLTGGVSPKLETRYSRIMVTFLSQESLQPQSTLTMEVAVPDVAAAYEQLLGKAKAAGARLRQNTLTRQPEAAQTEAVLNFDTPTPAEQSLTSELTSLGQITQSSRVEASPNINVTDARRGFAIKLISALRLPPTSVEALSVETPTSDTAPVAQKLASQAQALGGKVVEFSGSSSLTGGSHRLVVDLPTASAGQLTGQVGKEGKILSQTKSTKSASTTPLDRARIEVTLTTPSQIVPPDQGLMSSLRKALSTSALGLLWSLQLLVIGLCLLLPWAAVIYVGTRLWKRRSARTTTATA